MRTGTRRGRPTAAIAADFERGATSTARIRLSGLGASGSASASHTLEVDDGIAHRKRPHVQETALEVVARHPLKVAADRRLADRHAERRDRPSPGLGVRRISVRIGAPLQIGHPLRDARLDGLAAGLDLLPQERASAARSRPCSRRTSARSPGGHRGPAALLQSVIGVRPALVQHGRVERRAVARLLGDRDQAQAGSRSRRSAPRVPLCRRKLSTSARGECSSSGHQSSASFALASIPVCARVADHLPGPAKASPQHQEDQGGALAVLPRDRPARSPLDRRGLQRRARARCPRKGAGGPSA